MLGLQEPLDCRVKYTGVLDLRTVKMDNNGWASPQSENSVSPPPPMGIASPTMAITQRVIAAAQGPQGTRPFKAYPKDPLSLSTSQSEAYVQFRHQMLAQVRNGKSIKRRPSSPQQPSSSGGETDDKDAAYWERRRKNNEAAKRSRDARRAKEDEIAIRAAFLEQENLRLKYQIAALTDETAKLRCMLYKSEHSLI